MSRDRCEPCPETRHCRANAAEHCGHRVLAGQWLGAPLGGSHREFGTSRRGPPQPTVWPLENPAPYTITWILVIVAIFMLR
jgi:hypothetical protein